MMTTVSVVIPVYNKEKFLVRTIESVLGQTYKDFEVIAVDDGSSDQSVAILRRYGNKIQLHEQANSGPGAARNRGISLGRGKYIAFLDADDVWRPDKLQQQIEFHESHPDILWSACNYRKCDEDMKVNGLAFEEAGEDWVIYEDWFLANLRRYRILTSGVIVKKSVFDRVGSFDAEIPAGQDVDLWIRIALFSRKYGYCRQPLFDYLDVDSSVSSASPKKFESVTRLMEKHLASSHQSTESSYHQFMDHISQRFIRRAIGRGYGQNARQVIAARPKAWNSWSVGAYWLLALFPAAVQKRFGVFSMNSRSDFVGNPCIEPESGGDSDGT